MLVRVFATKPGGYCWKAPSFSDGKMLSMESGTEMDLDAGDMAALEQHVKDGYWLRYEPAEAPKPVKADPPAEKAKK